MTFKVDRTPAVSKQLRAIAERAKARRLRQSYLDALTNIVENLQNRPLEWGDPEYATKTAGGLVCHGFAWPLSVRFIVFESLRTVLIFELAALPYTPIADD